MLISMRMCGGGGAPGVEGSQCSGVREQLQVGAYIKDLEGLLSWKKRVVILISDMSCLKVV